MRHRFSDCMLDTERRELRRAGELIPLRAKVYQLLVFLLENRARAVAKGEILERLWPKRVVSDATLNSCIKELRRAVGDSGESQRIVQTLHGHGFRFVAPLEPGMLVDAGTRVPDRPAATASEAHAMAATTSAAPGREIKRVSVLVCSVADSDLLASRLGAEGLDELLQRFFVTARGAIERHGGFVSEWTDDGFMALFGAPVGLEDHGRCAVQAALELQTDLASNDEIEHVTARMALHTDAVVVGRLEADSGHVFTAAGDATRRARRLLARAAPGTLLSSEPSYRLVETEVDAEELEPVDGLPAFRIDRVTTRRAGVPHRATRSLSEFVGRDREMALLRERLGHAQTGQGQVVCVTGEPGIGKSRLLTELRKQVESDDFWCVTAHCLAYQANTPYFPISSWLRELCDTGEQEPTDVVLGRLRKRLLDAGIDDREAPPLIAELLDLATDREALAELGPEARRASTFAYLNQLLRHRARERTCLLILEDLHWLDPTSEAWLAQLITQIESLPALLLVSYRPGYQPPWATQSAITQLALPRLTVEDSAALIRSVPRELPPSPAVVRNIIANAQGNPFFLEELTWTVAGDPADHSGGVTIPGTVQAVLAARIDQLAAADKQLLQVAAVVGTTFVEPLLIAIAGHTLEALRASLAVLQIREFIYQTAALPRAEFAFKHALTRDVAYQSLLGSTRRQLHQRIAEALEHDFPELVSAQPELLAMHWAEAGQFRSAFACWRRAGERAIERSANPEAVAHLRRALEMGERLEQTPTNARHRLEILLMLGPPLMVTLGFAAPQVESVYLSARELSRDVGTEQQLFAALWGLWLHNQHRSRIGVARDFAAQVLELSSRITVDECSLQAHHAAWTTELTHGDLESCRRHAGHGLKLYDRARHHARSYLFGGHDPGLCALNCTAQASWYLGFPDTALRTAQRELELVNQLKHPFSRVLTLNGMMWVHTCRREPRETQRYAELATELCASLQSPNYLATSQIFQGWAAVMCDEVERGLELLRAGLSAYRALGLERHRGHFLTLFADCCLRLRLIDAGLEAVQEAAELIARTEEQRYLPEASRMRGELLLAQHDPDDRAAEICFQRALDEAHAQKARAFELRAATSLARLWNSRGEPARSHALLAPLLAQFNEGAGLPDLVGARQAQGFS